MSIRIPGVMKLIRLCSSSLALIMIVAFSCSVIYLVRRTSNGGGAVLKTCKQGKDGQCIVESGKEDADLMRLVNKRRSQLLHNMTSGRITYMDHPEEMFHKLAKIQHRFKMRSESNKTVFKSGYDTGVSEECLSRDYGDLKGWPTASIVLPFCENEKLSDVLHTVHSIIQRSPPQLLKEIILIDDNTTKDNFKEVLTNYCESIFGDTVRIIKSERALGLIQGRLLGARLARGDVVITMDAHMEVQEKWLEALLYEIRLDRKTMATAMLDWMKPLPNGNWLYEKGINSFMCVFTWDLGFGFAYPREEIRNKMAKDKLAAFPAPCSVGTIWAIEKAFFQEIGELDEGMEFWGGENLDLPIRTWLFGGRAVQVPCSHAAHLERPHQRDYRYGKDKFIQQNYKRVIEVWFDEYKDHVYRMKPELKTLEATDISARLKLKERAPHNFSWFLANIYPELGVYNNNSFGYNWLRNLGMNKCLHKVGNEFIMWECLGQAYKEGIWWTNDGHLRTDLQYWHVNGKNVSDYHLNPEGATGVYQADWLVKWIHWKGGPVMVYSKEKGIDESVCMEAYDTQRGSRLHMNTCDPQNKYQRWEWRTYSQDYHTFMSENLKSRFTSAYHKTALEVMAKWDKLDKRGSKEENGEVRRDVDVQLGTDSRGIEGQRGLNIQPNPNNRHNEYVKRNTDVQKEFNNQEGDNEAVGRRVNVRYDSHNRDNERMKSDVNVQSELRRNIDTSQEMRRRHRMVEERT